MLLRLCTVLFLSILWCASPVEGQQAGADSPRERLNFNADWRFHYGDPDDAANGVLSYDKLKDFMLATGNDLSKKNPVQVPSVDPGANVSFVKPDFDDTTWRSLNLPHDWGIEGPFDISARGETGKLKYWGQGWYRKHFNLPAADAGRSIYLDIDGAMSRSCVWVNGKLAGGWAYGYSSYEINLTPYLKFGADNVIAIRLDNPQDSSRWYPGGGIYRNVWLTKTGPVHVAHWGTYLTTPEISASSATVSLITTVQNQSATDAQVTLTTSILELDANDQKGAKAVTILPKATLTVPAGKPQAVTSQGPVADPKLWDTVNPQRYVAVTQVEQDGKVVDEFETPFGIRTMKFTLDQGFLLNGKHVPLNGVCDHHDLGALGTAFNTRAAERQLQILKEMGVNALRTSHNMPAPELLDLCDKMGILVMDESFDCWRHGKTGQDYGGLFDDWHERDIRAEVRRDRNHPSVIIWSMGNEIPEQGNTEGVATLTDLAGIAREEDSTRCIGEGTNHAQGFDAAFVNLFDAVGVNYDPGMYTNFRRQYPDMPLFSSESSSTCSTRGVYFLPPSVTTANFQVNSYDTYFPGWATLPDVQFAAIDKHPYVAGEFVWSGFDYLGEPTPYNSDLTNLLNFRDNPEKQAKMAEELKRLGKIRCPARSSYFGIVDLCGFKKDRFFLYQAHWRPDFPMAHILPHWNWVGHEGQKIPVYVYTSGDEAELFLNGKSLGRRRKSNDQALPANLARNGTATASSEETVNQNHNDAGKAVDGNGDSRWCASDGSKKQWWQVDLGKEQDIRSIMIDFEMGADKYQYQVSTSNDGANWQRMVDKNDWSGDSSKIVHPVHVSARYLKITFTDLASGAYASIREVGVYPKEVSADSFSANPYRLIWNNVDYEPGELKVVAYKNGQSWATSSVKTTGAASGLQLEADRAQIRSDGLDLCYLTTRVVDPVGLMVPTAQDTIKYEVTSGPGEIVATDNGDPTDLTMFNSPERNAFNGMALLIVRVKAGQKGDIHISASSDGLKSADCVIHAE